MDGEQLSKCKIRWEVLIAFLSHTAFIAHQSLPLMAFKRFNLLWHLETMFSIWALKDSFWSNVIPRNLHCFSYFTRLPLSQSLGLLSFFEFMKKLRQTVLSGFIPILHFEQKFSKSVRIGYKWSETKLLLLFFRPQCHKEIKSNSYVSPRVCHGQCF